MHRPRPATSPTPVRGLRALASAANAVQAAEAGSLLGGGGVVHGHSAAVFPAAAVAAPLLLGIAQRGHPAARDIALGLIDEALSCDPYAGYTRVAAPGGIEVPVCCAIAQHVRDRAGFLAGLGKKGRALLAEAAAHWRFEVSECVADDGGDGGGTVAFGVLSGCLPDGVHAAEMHLADAGAVVVLDALTLEYPPAENSGEACVRVAGDVPAGAVLLPAEYGERVH